MRGLHRPSPDDDPVAQKPNGRLSFILAKAISGTQE